MHGFLDFVNPNQGREILGQWIERARLGLHLRLAELSIEISQALIADNAATAARLISAYFDEVGLDASGIDGFSQLNALGQLEEMNAIQFVLPFQTWQPPEAPRPVYDYLGRQWAWWIHKLATRYGWSRDDIFDLWPEEAMAYLQEIFVAEFDEADEARALSEMAYTYDKHTKESRFRPLPRPSWMVDKPEPEMIRIRRDWLPVGNVIKLNELEPDDIILH
jgi:hypothetical protein